MHDRREVGMKLRRHIAILLFLAVSSIVAPGCSTTPPAKNNQPKSNANVAQANSSPGKPSQQPNQSATGTIVVTSIPSGARVLLVPTDEGGAGEPQPRGLTPTTITGLHPGKYTVHLERPGYRFFQKEIQVKAGTVAKVNPTLKKQ